MSENDVKTVSYGGDGAEVEITPEMIEAGYETLAAAGPPILYFGSEMKVAIRDAYAAMALVAKRSRSGEGR